MGATKPMTVRAWSGTDDATRAELEYVAAAGGPQELVRLARALHLPEPRSRHPLDPGGALEAVSRPGVVFCRRLDGPATATWQPVRQRSAPRSQPPESEG
jgi:hypothetical protein